jgi:Ni,Fe-hydrogenase I cytochrome b subunit
MVVSAAENLVVLLNTKYYIQIDYQPSDHPEEGQATYLKKTMLLLSFVLFLLSSTATLLIIMFLYLGHNLEGEEKVEDALFIKNEWYNQTWLVWDGV